MPDYAALQALAQRLISESGRTVTLLKRSATPTDANKPWRSGSPNVSAGTSLDVTAVFVDAGSDSAFAQYLNQEAPETTKRRNSMFLVAGGATELRDFQQIEDGDTIWRIVSIKTLQPGGTVLLYSFEVVR